MCYHYVYIYIYIYNQQTTGPECCLNQTSFKINGRPSFPGRLRTGKCADATPSKKAPQTGSLHPRSRRGQCADFPDMRISLLIWSSEIAAGISRENVCKMWQNMTTCYTICQNVATRAPLKQHIAKSFRPLARA